MRRSARRRAKPRAPWFNNTMSRATSVLASTCPRISAKHPRPQRLNQNDHPDEVPPPYRGEDQHQGGGGRGPQCQGQTGLNPTLGGWGGLARSRQGKSIKHGASTNQGFTLILSKSINLLKIIPQMNKS